MANELGQPTAQEIAEKFCTEMLCNALLCEGCPVNEMIKAAKQSVPMENVINLIRAERERQNEKWGEQNHDDYRWLAILTEEVGELAQAILHDEFGGSHAGTAEIELIHVAAVAVQWLECMERRKSNPASMTLKEVKDKYFPNKSIDELEHRE